MAHEEIIEATIKTLQKATARQVGELLHSKGLVSTVESGDATCRRVLGDLITKGEIKKDGSCFMLPHLSGYGDHDKKLTGGILEFMKRWECVVYREHSVVSVGLRPDALILVKNEDRRACIILEVVNKEKNGYLKQKETTWKGWKSSRAYLSELFCLQVPNFVFCTAGRNFEGITDIQELIKQMETV